MEEAARTYLQISLGLTSRMAKALSALEARVANLEGQLRASKQYVAELEIKVLRLEEGMEGAPPQPAGALSPEEQQWIREIEAASPTGEYPTPPPGTIDDLTRWVVERASRGLDQIPDASPPPLPEITAKIEEDPPLREPPATPLPQAPPPEVLAQAPDPPPPLDRESLALANAGVAIPIRPTPVPMANPLAALGGCTCVVIGIGAQHAPTCPLFYTEKR